MYTDAAADFDAAIAEGPVSWQRLWHRATCLAELGEPYKALTTRDLKDCLSLAGREEPPPEVTRTGGTELDEYNSTVLQMKLRVRNTVSLDLRMVSKHPDFVLEGEN